MTGHRFHNVRLRKKVPALRVGTFFLAGLAAVRAPAADDMALAAELFGEAQWAACRTECLRVLASQPGHETAILLRSVADIRLGRDATASLEDLCRRPPRAPEVAAMAAWELGRARWAQGRPEDAFAWFRQAFNQSGTPELFLRAGCSLHALLDERPELRGRAPELQSQLAAAAPLWTPQVRRDCEPPAAGGAPGRPAEWMIAFYQAQIGPAIGRRCSLRPTCSEYARQALAAHGLLGLAIYADRNIREPDVVAAAERPVRVAGRRYYEDPVEDHTWWLNTR